MVRNYYVCLLAAVAFVACEPDKDYLVAVDYNRIGYVLSDNSDNFNLSIFNTALRRTVLDKVLLENGPFTVLVPSDQAFAKIGYATSTDMLTEASATVGELLKYHILEGNYDLKRLPFLFNQEIRTRAGKPIYVTHWMSGADTLLLVNGEQLTSTTLQASNGLIQVIDQVLNPSVHSNVVDILKDNETVSIFSHALQRSGLANELSGPGPYTVFAPSNAAMAAFGYPTVQAVDAVAPSSLADLVRYHVMRERRFVNDFTLAMALDDGEVSRTVFWFIETGVKGIQYGHMLDGSTITFQVVKFLNNNFLGPIANPVRELTVIDISNTTALISTDRLQRDIVADNGVVHMVNSVFRKTL